MQEGIQLNVHMGLCAVSLRHSRVTHLSLSIEGPLPLILETWHVFHLPFQPIIRHQLQNFPTSVFSRNSQTLQKPLGPETEQVLSQFNGGNTDSHSLCINPESQIRSQPPPTFSIRALWRAAMASSLVLLFAASRSIFNCSGVLLPG